MTEPRISVIVPAYNMAAFVGQAIESALNQEGIDDSVEVIVVDDGSTDESPAVLAAFGDRIRVVRQENAGQEAAVDRGLLEAKGKYIALLDADDIWPPDRLARHIPVLDAYPKVGLTYGDMEVIDTYGNILERSYYETRRIVPDEGRILGRLVCMNFIGTSGITFRSVLIPAVRSTIRQSAYTDWGTVVGVAAVAEIARIAGISYGYRFHENNRLFGTAAMESARNEKRNLPWYRWMLTNVVDDPAISAAELNRWRVRFRDCLRLAASAGDPVRSLIEVDPVAAEQLLEDAPAVGPGALRSRTLLRAWSHNPFDGALEIELQIALAAEANIPEPPPTAPFAALRTFDRITLARAEEIVEAPEKLHAYVQGLEAGAEASLVVMSQHGSDLTDVKRTLEAELASAQGQLHFVLIDEPATTPAWALLESRASGWLTGTPDRDGVVAGLS